MAGTRRFDPDEIIMLSFYRTVTRGLAPLLKLFLKYRLSKGKEDPTRLYERFGKPSFQRPEGRLIWFHGASVGESLSLLKLLETFQHTAPEVTLLVTTGTVTSARLLAAKLPRQVFHQFVPLDVPQWVDQFLSHWQPDLAVILESEIWPNIIMALHKGGTPIVLLNGSLSERSFDRWIKFSKLTRPLFQSFHSCLTPSPVTAERYKALGVPAVELSVNLKCTSSPLPFPLKEANHLRDLLKDRPVWVAASTHDPEEEVVFSTHLALKERYPNLLTIVIPRHIQRSPELIKRAESLGLTVSTRQGEQGLNQIPTPEKDVWLINTMGELGLIYEISQIVLLGGTFAPLGGHNPVEPIQQGNLVLYGPHDANIHKNYAPFKPAMVPVATKDELIQQLAYFFDHPEACLAHQSEGLKILQTQQSGLDKIIQHLVKAMPL